MTRSRVKRAREKSTGAKQQKRYAYFHPPSAKEDNNSTVFQNSSSYAHRTQHQTSHSSEKESRDHAMDSSSSLTRDAASFFSSSSFSSSISGGFPAENSAESTAPVLFFNNGCSSRSSTDDCSSTLSSPCLPSLVKAAVEEWKPNQLRRGVLLERTVNSKTARAKESIEEKEEECFFADNKGGDSMTLGDLLGFSLTQKSRQSTPMTVNVAMERKRLCTTTGGGSDVISSSSFPFSDPLFPCSSPTTLCSNRFSLRSDTNGKRNSTSSHAVNHAASSVNECHPTEKKIETKMTEENASIENESEKEEKDGTIMTARRTIDTCGVSPSLSISVSPLTSKVLVQTQLDFGQKDAARLGVWCPHCQLLYSPHQEEDNKLHRRVCSFAGSGRQRKQRQADKSGEKRSVLSEADFRAGSSNAGKNAEKKVDCRTSCAANSPAVGSVLSSASDRDTTTSVMGSSISRFPSNAYDDKDKEEKEVNRGIHRLPCSSSRTVRNEGSRTPFHSRAVREAAERAAAALLSLAFQAASPTASFPFGSPSAAAGFHSPQKKKMSPFHTASSSSSDFLFSVHLERQEVLLDPHTASSFSSPLIVFLISVRYYGWGVMWEKAPELAKALEDLGAVKNDDGGASSSVFHPASTTRGIIREDRNENNQDSVPKKGHRRKSSTVAFKGVNACQDSDAQERSKLEMQMVKEEPATRKIHEEESVMVCGVAIREGSAMKGDFLSSAFYAPNVSCSLFSSSLPITRATSNCVTNRSSTTTTAFSNIHDDDRERSLPILLCAVFGKAHTREQEPQFESDPVTQMCVLRRQCSLADVEHLWILPILYWPPSPAQPSHHSFDFIISPSNFIPRPKEERKTEDERERMSAFLLVIRCWCQNVIYGASLCCRSQLSFAAHLFRNTPKPLTLQEEETHVESFLRTWWSDEEKNKNLIRGDETCCTDDTEKELDDWTPFVHNDGGDDALAED